MKVVSDTSPICYSNLIDHVELLPKLFGEVAIPEAVERELGHPDAPEAVRSWIAEPPEWLRVFSVKSGDEDVVLLVWIRESWNRFSWPWLRMPTS